MMRLVKFMRLPWPRRALLVRCWLELNLMALALRLFALKHILAYMGTNTVRSGTRSRFTREAIVWSVRAAAALSFNPTCAVRALVAERLLRRNGHAAQFKIGVTAGNNFQAHAWVEDESGILVGESELPYHPLPDLSAHDLVTPSR